MLHIVNKSPFQTSTLESCLRMALPGSAVLFIEDGVYAAAAGTAMDQRVRDAAKSIKLYVLQPDVDARGLAGKVIDGITAVDYGGFVDLTLEYPATQSWL